MYPQLLEAYHYFVYTFISLFAILNPLGMSPVFLSMTQDYSVAQKKTMAWQVAFKGAVMLIVVFFMGSAILGFFGIPLASLQIGGGLLIISAAWQMLNASGESPEHQAPVLDTRVAVPKDITFFPLTLPITVGAGSMSITIALSAGMRQATLLDYTFSHVGAVLGICAVFSVVGFCYSWSDRIFRWLGETGTNIVARMSAFILLAIGVTVAWDGMRVFLLALHP